MGANIAIANSALIKLGLAPIIALDYGTASARLCSEQGPKVVGALFAARDWKFDAETPSKVFLECAAWALAADIAYALTNSLDVARYARRNFLFWFALARLADGARGFWLRLRTVI